MKTGAITAAFCSLLTLSLASPLRTPVREVPVGLNSISALQIRAVPVQAPAPTSPGTSTACAKFAIVKTGDTCNAIASANGLDLQKLTTLNTFINKNCDNLIVGNAICVEGV